MTAAWVCRGYFGKPQRVGLELGKGVNVHLAIAAVADAGQAVLTELDALVAGVHVGEKVLGAGELPRRALLAGAEGADPEAGAHVAVLPQQAQPMLQLLCYLLPMLPLDDCECNPQSGLNIKPNQAQGTCNNVLLERGVH